MISQKLLRHLKGRLSFVHTEMLRSLLSELRKGITKAEFHRLADNLARDTKNYGVSKEGK